MKALVDGVQTRGTIKVNIEVWRFRSDFSIKELRNVWAVFSQYIFEN